MIIIKCGNCGHMYDVDEEKVANLTFGHYCPNCETPMRESFRIFANMVVNANIEEPFKEWEIFKIPEESTTLKVSVTYSSK